MKQKNIKISHSRVFLSGISALFEKRRDPRLQISGMTGRVGFTLIELLVVVLIIGVLSAIALPMYENAAERARIAQIYTLLGTMDQAENVYYLNNGDYTGNFTELDVQFPYDGKGQAKYFDGGVYHWMKWTPPRGLSAYRNYKGELYDLEVNFRTHNKVCGGEGVQAERLCKSLGFQTLCFTGPIAFHDRTYNVKQYCFE